MSSGCIATSTPPSSPTTQSPITSNPSPPGATAPSTGFWQHVGLDPVVASKLLPTVLGLLTTFFCFQLALELLPIPLTGFLASLLLNQNLWMQDGLASATPRAFLYPILMAFLYTIARRSGWGICLAIAALGVFYPSLVLVCAALLVLRCLSIGRKFPFIRINRRDMGVNLAGLTVAAVVVLVYAITASEFAPIVSLEQARSLPEFSANGRTSFFSDDPWQFWLNGTRSGINLPAALIPPLNYIGLLLIPMLCRRHTFPLLQQLNAPSGSQTGGQFERNIVLLGQLAMASALLFFAAHHLLFQLHLPSRYTLHTLRILMSLSAAIVLTILLDSCLRMVHPTSHWGRSAFAWLSAGLLLVTAIGFPITRDRFIWTGYRVGTEPALYEFFQAQPADITIASLEPEADNLPAFTRRAILAGAEYSIPFHLGYYLPLRQRTIALLIAQYTNSPTELLDVLDTYQPDYWLLSRDSFSAERLRGDRWLQQFQPAFQTALSALEEDRRGVMQQIANRCTVVSTDRHTVVDTHCLRSQLTHRDTNSTDT